MNPHSTEEKRRTGRLVAINRSDGGLPKSQVSEALISESGVEGDRQRNPSTHGGADRAVVLYSLDLIQALASEGHSIQIGTLGENLTIADLDWSLMVPGAEFLVGQDGGQAGRQVRLRITQYALPCTNIKPLFANKDSSRISPTKHPGWGRACARVLAGGVVHVGDPVVLL